MVMRFRAVVRGLVAVLVTAAATALIVVSAWYRGRGARVIELSLLFVALALGVSAIEVLGVAHRLTPGGIERVTPWRRRVLVQWSEATSVAWRGAKRGFEVRSRRGDLVFVYEQLTGMASFARGVLDGVPAHVLDAQPGLRDRLERAARGMEAPDEPEREEWRGG